MWIPRRPLTFSGWWFRFTRDEEFGQTSGASSGGFLSTHPGTADRIEAIRKLP